MPAEIVWILGSGDRSGPTPEECERGLMLAAQGFLLAFDGVTIASLADASLVKLLPAYVLIGAGFAERLKTGAVARAEMSALLSFFGRLRIRVVARGVDDERLAALLLEAGLQFGIGRYLQGPMVLDPEFAEAGDEVVTRAWFRARVVRVPRPPRRGAGGLLQRLHEIRHRPRRPGLRPGAGRGGASPAGRARRRPCARSRGGMAPPCGGSGQAGDLRSGLGELHASPRLVLGEELEGLTDLDDPIESGITGWAFLRGEPYLCGDTFTHEAAIHVPGSSGGRVDESLLVIPLIAGDNRLGVLDLWRDGLDSFSDVELERCALFGYLAAAAWRNAQLYAELEQRAVTDRSLGS